MFVYVIDVCIIIKQVTLVSCLLAKITSSLREMATIAADEATTLNLISLRSDSINHFYSVTRFRLSHKIIRIIINIWAYTMKHFGDC